MNVLRLPLAPEPVSALAVPELINAAPEVLARASAAIVATLVNFVFFIFILDLKIFSCAGYGVRMRSPCSKWLSRYRANNRKMLLFDGLLWLTI